MHVLLVKPMFYTRYPPIGLLKIASYHRNLGDTVEYIEGEKVPTGKPDLIYITSLFTYAWKPVYRAVKYYKEIYPDVKVILGGIYASLMPDHAALSGADEIYVGLFEEAEDLMPAYDLVPDWDGSIIFASRGCIRRCPFCAVPKLEGGISRIRDTIKPLVYPKHTKIILWDNNILASPKWRDIFDELEELGKKVDFNQGIDARLITDEIAEKLASLKTNILRLAYDSKSERKALKKAIEKLNAAGINGRKILVYILYNFRDDPQDFYERVRDVLEWGAVAYPMRFEPLDSLEKNKYVSPNWSVEQLEMVAKARRVLGYSGALPPYKALVEKFRKAETFEEAFKLRPPSKKQKKNTRRKFNKKSAESKRYYDLYNKIVVDDVGGVIRS
ncbi:B12-binding domain-containing radical SAM protein [Archaeoglobus neptunius]|uniref:B12-binding domain-containing radical SAM protein n=1 Tax=Archaeoglobus neptunius TaxID=2798580 RepID=UPI001E405E18|nr:cobalamin-dependent protein [Archaeoglobus neptunius]